jgi:limonene 1,2-monooxygenase
MVLLDHLTRGRVMLGVGPGALVTDAMMLGIDPPMQRPRMAEALDVIVRLLTESEPITHTSDWFEVRDAVLQLRPYAQPHFPIAVASTQSPAGMVLAGRYGFGVLQLAAAVGVRGAVDLHAQWQIGQQAAAAAGKSLSRAQWSLVVPLHLAETRQEALAAAREGGAAYLLDYFGTVLGRPPPVDGPRDRVVEQMADSGTWIVGTPDDCIAAIERYREATGGFGGLLILAHEWASWEATRRSYELLARYVMPRFQGSLAGVEASAKWAAGRAQDFRARAAQAIEDAHRSYERPLVAPAPLSPAEKERHPVGEVAEL